MKKILLGMQKIVTGNMKLYLQQMGYEVEEWVTPYEKGLEKCNRELSDILDDSYYGVLMYNYFPSFAQICYEKNIYYITWITDNPLFSLWSDTVRYATNRIFLFDKSQYEEMRTKGIENIFYLPLGTDAHFFDKIDCHKKIFRADVAFVGSLYNDSEKNMFRAIKYLPPYVKGYVNAVIQSQLEMQQNIMDKQIIPPEVWKELKRYVHFSLPDSYDFSYEDWFISSLQRETTSRERCNAVSLLNEYFDFKLYTGSDIAFYPRLKKEGYVNYETEMPLVFRQSRININITLRSITTGIPLRALDIMACKGFLLSNYQEELAEYFEDGKECVLFYDLEDMIIKTDYYLKHEDERQRIAIAGYEKVKNEFSLQGQLAKMRTLLAQNE